MFTPYQGRTLLYGLVAVSFSLLLLSSLPLRPNNQWRPHTPLPEQKPGPENPFHSLPDYDLRTKEKPECADRFGRKYLNDLRQSATEYCEADSNSKLTCFHSQTASDGRIDSFCLGGPATIDSDKKFSLGCNLRNSTESKASKNVPELHSLQSYWYETGPGFIFSNSVKMDNNDNGFAKPQETKNYTILLKREGEKNTWHCLMEIFSMTLTLDVLKISRNEDKKPLLTSEDAENTQIVILDERENGPYFDLWSLFAERPTVRLADLPEGELLSENIIVPLAGGSNPLWQGDWDIHSCERSDLLRVFSERVLDHFGVEKSRPKTEDIVITFIDRKSRRLMHQESYLAALSQNMSHVKVQSIDFADISFKEQLEVARDTDILVGVHGAGLTHSMFLRERSAVVEILPHELNHKGFRNLASLQNHLYLSVHGLKKPPHSRRDSWHGEDIFLEKQRFLELMSVAIKALYSQGPRGYDAV